MRALDELLQRPEVVRLQEEERRGTVCLAPLGNTCDVPFSSRQAALRLSMP